MDAILGELVPQSLRGIKFYYCFRESPGSVGNHDVFAVSERHSFGCHRCCDNGYTKAHALVDLALNSSPITQRRYGQSDFFEETANVRLITCDDYALISQADHFRRGF